MHDYCSDSDHDKDNNNANDDENDSLDGELVEVYVNDGVTHLAY